MTPLKRIACTCVVIAAALLATGTGSFSALQADRTGSVEITDDSDALLGLDMWESEERLNDLHVGESFYLTVTDNSGTGLEVRHVTSATDDIRVQYSSDVEAELYPHESEGREAIELICTNQHEGAVTIRIRATSSEVRIEKTKIIDGVDCSQKRDSNTQNATQPSPVTYHGCDQATLANELPPTAELYLHIGGDRFLTLSAQEAEARGLLGPQKQNVTLKQGNKRLTRIVIDSEEFYNTNDCSPWGDLDN